LSRKKNRCKSLSINELQGRARRRALSPYQSVSYEGFCFNGVSSIKKHLIIIKKGL
jgi:hypothetical protein